MPKQVTIAPEVHDVLSRCTVDHNRTVVILPQGQLPRDLYVAVDKVLKALGGKWDRRLGGHVFPRPVEGELDAALRSGVAVDQARTAEQFFTPERVARRMAELAMIEDGTHVLEPSAGAGVLVKAALDLGGHVTAVELDERLIPGLREVGQQRHGWVRVCHADFMEWEPRDAPAGDFCDFTGPFDVVLMNPPFSLGQDMAHVTKALQLLRPGGLLMAIMSPHWRWGTDRASAAFRELAHPSRAHWEPLPDGTFRESGTAVNTGILTLMKGTDQ